MSMYRIVLGADIPELETNVALLMLDGWQPIGAAQLFRQSYAQTMVRCMSIQYANATPPAVGAEAHNQKTSRAGKAKGKRPHK